MSAAGFYKRRRGILEHLEAGRISLLDLAVHDLICLRANAVVGNGSFFSAGCLDGFGSGHPRTMPEANLQPFDSTLSRPFRETRLD